MTPSTMLMAVRRFVQKWQNRMSHCGHLLDAFRDTIPVISHHLRRYVVTLLPSMCMPLVDAVFSYIIVVRRGGGEAGDGGGTGTTSL